MSDTPITDEKVRLIDYPHSPCYEQVVPSHLARQLERELNQLREACHIFLDARKHDGHGMEDAEKAIREALDKKGGE